MTRARELGLARATVLRGRMGFGRSQRLHNASILRLSFDLPMILEIEDTSEKDRSLPARTKTNDAYRIDHRRTGPNCSVSSLIGFCFIKDCLNAFDRYQAGTQDAFNCSEETLNLFLRVDDLDHDRKIER